MLLFQIWKDISYETDYNVYHYLNTILSEKDSKLTEVELLKATTETQLWLNEIAELEDDFRKYKATRAKLDETKSKGKSKKKIKKVKKSSKKATKLKLKA